ncbi:MAG TPA: phosphate ABC transporter, permease protein PstA, partial [Roseovarius nubinhibens]|nr:phosphate ABC transporter, permease protein PstA [Roseovarius nubinhibens]
MTDATATPHAAPATSLVAADARTQKRNRAERRFRAYGMAAILTGLFFLVVLVSSILYNGVGAFQQSFVNVPVYLDPAKLDKNGTGD